MSDSSVTPWAGDLQAPLGFPGKNTAVGCHFLLQGVFPTQGLSVCLLRWQVYIYIYIFFYDWATREALIIISRNKTFLTVLTSRQP